MDWQILWKNNEDKTVRPLTDWICIGGGFGAVIFINLMTLNGFKLPLMVFPLLVILLTFSGTVYSGGDIRKILHLTPEKSISFLKFFRYFILMFICMFLANYATQLICRFLQIPLPQQPLVELARYGSWQDFFQVAATAVIFAPAAEELYFRGALFRRLHSVMPAFSAMGITAIFFAAAHANLYSAASLLIMSVFLSLEYLRTNSVRNCILFHACNNLIAMLQILFFRLMQ